jgi:hypothetical protein
MAKSGGDLRKNASGYYDPTAFTAITNVSEAEKAAYLRQCICDACKIAGFRIEGRIVLIHKYSGNKYK